MSELKPTIPEKIKTELIRHGHTRIDNYYYFNQRENPKVIAYLEAENAYTKEMMKHTGALQEKLFNEIVGRIKQADMSVPYKHNGYYYYTKYEEGKEYPFYYRKKDSAEAEEEIMLNVNEMAKGYSYYHVIGLRVSPNNRLLAFAVDTLSRRKYDIYFKDLTTGKLLKDKITNTTGSLEWANDNKTVYFSIKDNTLRSYKIISHILGAPSDQDKEVFHETDETFSVYIGKSKSQKYLFISSYSTLSSEYRFLDANNPGGDFIVFQPRERDLEYSVEHFENKFYIRTNYQAKNFRLMEVPLDKPGKENWKEVIPHRDNVLLERMEIFEDYLVLQERKNGLIELRIINRSDNSEHYIQFDEETYVAYLTANYELNTELLRFGYTSLTTPPSTFDYNMRDRTKILLKQEEVLGGFDKDNYHSERLYAESDDGVKIPISLVYRKGLIKNGNNPTLLYGYGSYGISSNPYFNSAILSLLDRGFVYAIAHIRGGQELGRQWYEDGKLLKKKNTFLDFIRCAEFLIEQKFTKPEKLFARGGSAGGLLIGAVINMRSDLFKGVLAAVPFVDVVTTMLDETIPLTTSEYDEWGNPNEKEDYDYMLSYSPYDNVEKKDYPSMLVTTGLHDSQVQYWEPAKWVAKLREMKTDNNFLLLDTDMTTGHSGASGRFQRYKRTALEYAFVLGLADKME
jgi:oligopeptidase B